MSNTLIGRLEKSFNSCIYNLLKVNLQHLDLAEQFKLLSEHTLVPLKYRLFQRLAVFSWKIVNNVHLPSFSKELTVKVRTVVTRGMMFDGYTSKTYILPRVVNNNDRRLSIILPKLANFCFKDAFNLSLNEMLSDIRKNFTLFYNRFISKVFI